MAWQIPGAAGQWTPTLGMPQEMNMGSYTPEQWTVIQQQNWQQWAQWQQYSQWQSQYEEKYAQQLQAGQALSGMPPLPVDATVQPAPPPPDQPPPPLPPHENNQPLYGNKSQSNTTVPRNTSNHSNTESTTGNNQWSYGTDASKEAPSTANKDALKKLAEEEKSFDIQFQKWEEEIERWRKENVNHPDRQAYQQYEERFDLCRVQLLERRKQMHLKRARLLNPALPATNAPSGNTPTQAPAPNSQTNYKPNVQPQNYQNNTYQQDYNKAQSSYNQSRSNNKSIDPQDRYESYDNRDTANNPPHKDTITSTKSDPATFLQTSSSGKSIPGLDLVPDSSQVHKNQDVIDITGDRNEMQEAPDYSKISKGINNILGDAKIMNILSMVKGQNIPHSNNVQNVSPNNQNYPLNQGNRNQNNFEQNPQYGNTQNMPYNRQGPNFSMQQNQGMNLQQQGSYDNVGQDMQQDQYDDRNTPFHGPNNRGGSGGFDMRQGGPDMRQGGLDMRQGGPHIRQGRPDMRQVGSMWDGGNMRPRGPDIRQGGPDIRQGGPDMRQGGPGMRQGGPNMRQASPDMRQGGPDMRQGGSNMRQGGPDMRQGGADMRQGGPAMRQGGPDMRQGGPVLGQGGPNTDMRQGGSDMNQGGPNMSSSLLQDMRRLGPNNLAGNNNGSIQPLMGFNNGRPPLQDMNSQKNVNEYYGSEQPMRMNSPAMAQAPRPKWVEDPLFTPSLVVDYEHKPLRLKARDFIEPVHTFDYNHRSKDENLNKKKDFEKEVDELFINMPRREEHSDKYAKDLFYRDYERRGLKEDIRDMRDENRDLREDFRGMRGLRDLPREPPRADFERRRPDNRFDERRRDDIRDLRRDDTRDLRRDDSRDFRRDDAHDLRRDLRRDDTRDLRRDDIRDLRRDDTRDLRRDDNRDLKRDDIRDSRRDERRDDRKDDRRDDRDRFYRRDDMRERERERDLHRPKDDRSRDMKRDDHRSTSKETDTRKRALSKESEGSTAAKKSRDKDNVKKQKQHVVMIDDLLEPPGRDMRPDKIVIILRGLPGSGKSYLAKLIRDREAEHGGTARIMSIDDYFMQEGEIEEKDPQTGKMVKKPFLKYEYDESVEESYLNSLKRAFKRSLTDGYFSFLIYDAVNDQLKHYADIWNYARQSGFQVYICTMEQDLQSCFKRNIHNRKYEHLEVLKARFFETPAHHIQLDATTLLQSASIQDVTMEDVEDDVMEDVQEVEVESVFTSKWEKMDDATQLARLDGTSKPLRASQPSMADYLQLDEWKPNVAKPGKKTVRWADIEERREQEKMRAIGFVVGQTDWNRMNDPTMGSSALTQTKYIERVRRQ